MAADEIHLNDIGTVFTVTVKDGANAVDISAATTQQLIFQAPSGAKKTKEAAFVTDGSDGQLEYTLVDGDLDELGYWKLQAYVVSPAGSWHSDVSAFQVHPNL